MNRDKFIFVCAWTVLSIPLISGCLKFSSPTKSNSQDETFLLNLPATVQGSSITYELFCTDQSPPPAKESFKLIGSSASSDAGFSAPNAQGNFKFSFPTNIDAKQCFLQGKGASDANVKSKIRFLDRDGLYFDSDPKAVATEDQQRKLSISVRARYQPIDKTSANKSNSQTTTQTATATSTGSSMATETSTKTATGSSQSVNSQQQPFRELQLLMDGAAETCPQHLCNP